MSLVVSLLVLLISLVILSPLLDAYRVPSRKIPEPEHELENGMLTANYGVLDGSLAYSQDSAYVKKQKILYFNKLMSKNHLYGIWTNQRKNKDNEDIDQEGFATLMYTSGYHSIEESFDMTLCLYEGIYANTNYSCISLSEFIPFMPEKMFNENNSTLSFTNILVHIAEGKKNSINNLGKECTMSVTMHFVDISNNQPLIPSDDESADQRKFGVQFQVSSLNSECRREFSTEVMTKEDALVRGQSLKYLIIMSTLAVLQAIFCLVLSGVIKRDGTRGQKISQGTLRMIQCFDLYITIESIMHLSTNEMIGFVAVPYGILSFYFETKATKTVVDAQGSLPERGFPWLHRMNQFFFLWTTIVVLVSTVLKKPEWIFLMFALHQVPQILQNFATERKYNKAQYLVYLFLFPKLAYIAYVLAVPRNLFKFVPKKALFILLLKIMFFQIFVLFIQAKYPRFCFKRKCPYSFYKQTKKTKEEVCSICLENLETTTNTPTIPTAKKEGLPNNVLLPQENFEDKSMILTPCQHEFHEHCLRDWAKLKSVCPYCRFQLPPLPEEDD